MLDLSNLPQKPGVYLYKDEGGKVLYVGKAVNLRHRVRSYFQEGARHSAKTIALVEKVRQYETIVTTSELEALILESNLIKRYRPRYNIILRDDKSYPYLKLTTGEEYPRLLVSRRPHEDKNRYYGPYVSAWSMRETLRLIHKNLGIRQCNIEIDRKRPRPCIYYDLHQCAAPCVNWGETKEQYQEHVREVRLLLEGRQDSLASELEQRMNAAAEKQEYEEAARLRNSLRALQVVQARQKIVFPEARDVDVVALAFGPGKEKKEAGIQIFFIRGGKLVDRQTRNLTNLEAADPSEALESFLVQYYSGSVYVPQEVILQHPLDEPDGMAEWLSKRRGSKVTLTFPQRGEKLALVKMVEENAKELFKPEPMVGRSGTAPAKDREAALKELQQVFKLPDPPQRIEGFDISHIQGSFTVASMVVAEDGWPHRSEYRKYKIKSVQGVDDFASMREVVGRRYKRLLDENRPMPDLVLIDGGRGQLNAAMAALTELNLTHLPVFGLAKRLEEFYLPNKVETVQLSERSPGRLLVQRLRDEAHRFAITFHRSLRSKELRHSELDDLEGVGPATKKKLLKTFGGLEGVKTASEDDLLKIKGLRKNIALKIFEKFHATAIARASS
jgi:excinuclease ABC subunit C